MRNIFLLFIFVSLNKELLWVHSYHKGYKWKEQFKNIKFDLVIVIDNNAFDFNIKYHDYLMMYLYFFVESIIL